MSKLMPDHFQNIYAQHADRYEALVLREDYQGNILRALDAIHPVAGAEVVEFGAGTGRLTLLLAPRVRSIRAHDGSAHMLEVATAKLQQTGLTNWKTGVADNASLPEADASADIAIEGWSFGHCVGWYPDSWRAEIGKALAEMRRILRPGGMMILLETMGTGSETPQPPNAGLAACYAWLEAEQGFSHRAIRTDYQFESLAEAESLTRFFFGDDMAEAVLQNRWMVLPECTGVWWKRI
jgi:ubiquinone/menaquinone biosynthesis C-methylase UbiE